MEIKFNAWDKAKKQFVPPSWVAVDGSGILYNNSYENSHFDPKDWVLRLCTGLKDNKGEDIYEGDILRSWSGVAIVVWEDYMYMVKSPGSEAIDEMNTQEWANCEIVGNIFQNPELIK